MWWLVFSQSQCTRRPGIGIYLEAFSNLSFKVPWEQFFSFLLVVSESWKSPGYMGDDYPKEGGVVH